MEITTGEVNGVTVLHLAGSLTADTVTDLRRQIEALQASKRHRVVFNLDKVSMIDSSGLGAIVFTVKRCRAVGGDVKVAAAHGHVADVFYLVGFHKAIEMCPTADDAVSRFQKR